MSHTLTRTTKPDDYLQPQSGYRFSADSIELAKFTPEYMTGIAADLGAGCGVIGLEALASGRLKGLSQLFFVEAQTDFQTHLEANIALFPDTPKLFYFQTDWRYLEQKDFGGPLDYIVTNPPYFPANSGRLGHIPRARARHELLGNLCDLLESAARLLKPSGLMTMSWPSRGLSRLTTCLKTAPLKPRRFYFPPRFRSKLVLLELGLS